MSETRNSVDVLIEELRGRMENKGFVTVYRSELEAIILDRVRLKSEIGELVAYHEGIQGGADSLRAENSKLRADNARLCGSQYQEYDPKNGLPEKFKPCPMCGGMLFYSTIHFCPGSDQGYMVRDNTTGYHRGCFIGTPFSRFVKSAAADVKKSFEFIAMRIAETTINELGAELTRLRAENRALRGHPVEETPE